jgi:lactate permease
MATLIWASPLLVVVLLLATGRSDTMTASAIGAVLALVVAVSAAAPVPLQPLEALRELAKGTWLGSLAASVIFGGLFFQQVLRSEKTDTETEFEPPAPQAGLRRRQLFAACFLIGPFTESATGFGVGYVIALALISQLRDLPPLRLLIFGLFSQMLVPWGALAVGTVVGSHLSGLPTAELGVRSAILTAPLLALWLVLFWVFVAAAGLRTTASQAVDDALWTAAAAVLLIAANHVLDAEVAAVGALGPLIALRFWRDVGSSAIAWRSAIRAAGPYAALAIVLIAGRAVPWLHDFLANHAVVHPPLAGAAPWLVLLHPFVWLLLIPIAHAILIGRTRAIAPGLRSTWQRGRRAIAATVLFLAMAQLIAASGVARGLAEALLAAVGPAAAITAVPVFAAIGGLLTGSTTGANGLFMTSQVALGSAAGLPDIGWLAAVQNTAASAATMLSPIRVSMGCAWLGRPDLERQTYRAAWLLGVVPFLLMLLAAALVPWLSGAH